MTLSLAPKIPAARRANKADLAEWFDVSLPTVNAWIRRGCPVMQTGSRGVSWVFDLRDVAEWRYTGSIADPDDVIDPERMPPIDRRAWYEGEDKRISIAHRVGELVTIDEYRDELAGVLKEVAATLETLPDVLERKCGLSPEAIDTMQRIIDEQRAMLADRISHAA